MNLPHLIRMLLISLILLSSTFGQSTDTLRLSRKEALARGEQQGYAGLLALEQLNAASGNNLSAWGSLLPNVTLGGSFTRSTDPVTVFGLKLKQGVFSESDFRIDALNTPAEFENYGMQVQVQIPMINVDAIFGKAAASAMKRARREGLTRAYQAQSYHINAAYFGLILANESLAAIDEAIATATAHRDNARAGFEQGIVHKADYLYAEVRLNELQEQRILAGHQLHGISDGLKLLMGLDAEQRLLVPTDSLTVPLKTPGMTAGEALFAQRADLRALQAQSSAARYRLRAMRSGWLPRLNAFGAREWNAAEAFAADADNWTVGLQLSWRIFDGLGHWGRQQQAAAQLAEVRLQYRQQKQQAQNDVAAAQRSLKAAQQRISVAQIAVRQAQESLQLTEARYRQGLERTADLMEKASHLTRAKLRFLTARHDYNAAINDLNFTTGRSFPAE